ncbi:MAG: ABC transporter permease [Oligoflexia bacterium]|nr:ABC transporter permease [Oligoflexia bacterium]
MDTQLSSVTEWLASGVRMAIPLLFAAYGGLLTERSGIANIALEAYLLMSSYTAAAVMAITHNLYLAISAGMLAAVLTAGIFGFLTVKVKADQIVAGMAVNILVMGILPVTSNALFSVSGQTPTLSLNERIEQTWPFVAIGILLIFVTHWMFAKTRLGLRIWAAGENPDALAAQGVLPKSVRWKAVLLGGLVTSIGGIYLSIGAGSGYTRNMSAGRGYIALAALIFGKWKPIPTAIGCLLFGLADALQMILQSVSIFADGSPLPTQFVQMIPYVLTILVLAGFVGKVSAPKSLNTP